MTELKLDPRNARRHSDRNKRQIKQSLETVGAGRSILADADGIVRAGNGVFAEWGDKPIKIVETDGKELVVVQRTDLRGQDAIRAAALDNLVADSSAFDYDAAILAEIARDDDVIRAIANEDAKLRELLRKENGNAEKQDPGELIDKAAQLQEKWQVRRGDIWQVGNHRLMCGDSTSKADVERLIDGKRAQLLISDPPYNVGKDYGEKVDDDRAGEEYKAFLHGWFLLWQSISERQIVTIGRRRFEEGFWFGLPLKATGCWTKTNAISRGRITQSSCWEPIIFVGDGWKRTRPNDVFDYPIGMQKEVANHPCPKPLRMWVHLIEEYTEIGDIIADAFDGAGTTLAACEMTDRIGVVMEIEPKWVATSLERLANLGLQPQRLSDG